MAEGRIALLAPRGSPLVDGPQGGSGVVLAEDVEILRSAGWDVTVWAPEGSTAASVSRTVRIRVPAPLVSSVEYCAPFVVANRDRILLAYNEPTVALLAPERSIVRFDWPTPLPRYSGWPLVKHRAARARYLFPSDALRRQWLAQNPVAPPGTAVVVHNAVDLELFTPAPPPQGPPRVGFAGQWTPHKGLDVLAEAWPEVRRRFPDAELRIAGGVDLWQRSAPPEGADAVAALVRRLAAAGVGVELVGVLPRAEMPRFWRDVTVACVPSVVAEAFGLTALEAMACGRPVVAARSGALPEVVGDGGWLVPPSDAEALAEALVEALTLDGDARLSASRRARARAEQFGIDRRRTELLGLLEGRRQSRRGRRGQ